MTAIANGCRGCGGEGRLAKKATTRGASHEARRNQQWVCATTAKKRRPRTGLEGAPEGGEAADDEEDPRAMTRQVHAGVFGRFDAPHPNLSIPVRPSIRTCQERPDRVMAICWEIWAACVVAAMVPVNCVPFCGHAISRQHGPHGHELGTRTQYGRQHGSQHGKGGYHETDGCNTTSERRYQRSPHSGRLSCTFASNPRSGSGLAGSGRREAQEPRRQSPRHHGSSVCPHSPVLCCEEDVGGGQSRASFTWPTGGSVEQSTCPMAALTLPLHCATHRVRG